MERTWVMSSPRDGVPIAVLVGLPAGATLTAWFADDASERDLTVYVADLLLDGLLFTATTAMPTPAGGPQDPPVPVAELTLSCPAEDVTLLLVEPRAASVQPLPGDGLLDVLADGIAVAVTRAVTAEQDDPDLAVDQAVDEAETARMEPGEPEHPRG